MTNQRTHILVWSVFSTFQTSDRQSHLLQTFIDIDRTSSPSPLIMLWFRDMYTELQQQYTSGQRYSNCNRERERERERPIGSSGIVMCLNRLDLHDTYITIGIYCTAHAACSIRSWNRTIPPCWCREHSELFWTKLTLRMYRNNGTYYNTIHT